MGDSHFKSEVKGFAGTETISNFATITGAALVGTTSVTGAAVAGTTSVTSPAVEGTTSVTGVTVEGTTTVTSPKVIASSYMTVGDKYVFFSKSATDASIILEATVLVGTVLKGSITLGAGKLWVHNANTTILEGVIVP